MSRVAFFIVSVSLAGAGDMTAAAFIERVSHRPFGADKPQTDYTLRQLKRYALQTPYADVAKDLRKTFNKGVLRPVGYQEPMLALDVTSTGVMGGEAFEAAGFAPLCVAVVEGREVEPSAKYPRYVRVPLLDMVLVTQGLLEAGRVKIVDGVNHIDELQRELMALSDAKPKVDQWGVWREGERTGLAMAVATALWAGDRAERHGFAHSRAVEQAVSVISSEGWT
jgi:hypothetical protein